MKRIIFIIIGIFLSIEILLRLIFPEELRYSRRPLVYQADSLRGYLYKPNLYIETLGQPFRSNSSGFAGPEIPPKSNKFRIAILGYSWVSGSAHLAYYAEFCSLLQQKLTERGIDAEIINFGIDGPYTGHENMAFIEERLPEFSPDLVLFELNFPIETVRVVRECYNNYIITYSRKEPPGTKEKLMHLIDIQNKFRPYADIFYKNLYTARALYKMIRKIAFIDENIAHEQSTFEKHFILYNDVSLESNERKFDVCSFDKSVKWIRKIRADLKEKGADFFLFQYNQDLITFDIARLYKLPLITLNIQLDENDYIRKDGHPNERGHDKIAQAFCERLTKYNIIPPKYQKSRK